MTLLGLLVSLIFPACGASGAHGVPAPTPFNLAHLQRPASPNTALVAPPGAGPTPDIPAPYFNASPEALYRALRRVAEATPRTYLQSADDARHEAHYVARSAVFNFPDLITLAVQPDGAGSRPVLYSRSLYGHSDLGVNKKRLQDYLARLPAALADHP